MIGASFMFALGVAVGSPATPCSMSILQMDQEARTADYAVSCAVHVSDDTDAGSALLVKLAHDSAGMCKIDAGVGFGEDHFTMLMCAFSSSRSHDDMAKAFNAGVKAGRGHSQHERGDSGEEGANP